MSTNFLDVYLLSLILEAAAAATLSLLGMAISIRIILFWREGNSSEKQLHLEKQAELAATIIQVAFFIKLLGLALSVLTADHLTGNIRGAMCAFGVYRSTPIGFNGLLMTALSAAVCCLWLILHRLDLLLIRPVLVRRKFVALFLAAPLAIWDLKLVFAWVNQLDFKVIASCCSVWVDAAVIDQGTLAWGISRQTVCWLGLGTIFLALSTSFAVSRYPNRINATGACLASVAAFGGALMLIIWIVAPHALSTPYHLCPFCLLKAQANHIGWPLFASLFAATVAGLGIGVVEMQRRVINDPGIVKAMHRSLGRWSLIAWMITLFLGTLPVAQYLLRSGGVSVFGEL